MGKEYGVWVNRDRKVMLEKVELNESGIRKYGGAGDGEVTFVGNNFDGMSGHLDSMMYCEENTTIFMSSGTSVLGYNLVTEKKMIIRVGRFLGREMDHKFTTNEMLWNGKWKRLVCSLRNEKKVVVLEEKGNGKEEDGEENEDDDGLFSSSNKFTVVDTNSEVTKMNITNMEEGKGEGDVWLGHYNGCISRLEESESEIGDGDREGYKSIEMENQHGEHEIVGLLSLFGRCVWSGDDIECMFCSACGGSSSNMTDMSGL